MSPPEDETNQPPERRSNPSEETGAGGWMHRFRTTESGWIALVREVVTSVGMVVLVGLLLFGISGVWPPMVAVESGSMKPHMYRGDLVFIMDEHRFPGEASVADTGVTPYQTAKETGYWKFGDYGDVIVYRPDGSTSRSPIIHRAMFWVDEGENWYDKANKSHISATSCAQLTNCPAPHSGFITKGDNEGTNDRYDQASGMSGPVKPSWVRGTAEVRIPALGLVRLEWAELQRGGVPGSASASSPADRSPADPSVAQSRSHTGPHTTPQSDWRALSLSFVAAGAVEGARRSAAS